MSNIPAELKYIASHEWLRLEDDGTITIGITDHAQDLLGDVVFVELPDVGDIIAVDDEISVVESVKAASDIYCPLAGSIVAVNDALADEPELVNSSPYEDGWVLRLQPDDATVLEQFMDAEAYGRHLAELED